MKRTITLVFFVVVFVALGWEAKVSGAFHRVTRAVTSTETATATSTNVSASEPTQAQGLTVDASPTPSATVELILVCTPFPDDNGGHGETCFQVTQDPSTIPPPAPTLDLPPLTDTPAPPAATETPGAYPGTPVGYP